MKHDVYYIVILYISYSNKYSVLILNNNVGNTVKTNKP